MRLFCLCVLYHVLTNMEGLTPNVHFWYISSNSDIWRNYPAYMRKLYRWLYLTSAQGSSTSVAAAVLNDWEHDDTMYLQPYRLLPSSNPQKPPFPMLEMLGPYAGYVETTPRLPADGGIAACASLLEVCEEITGCQFPES